MKRKRSNTRPSKNLLYVRFFDYKRTVDDSQTIKQIKQIKAPKFTCYYHFKFEERTLANGISNLILLAKYHRCHSDPPKDYPTHITTKIVSNKVKLGNSGTTKSPTNFASLKRKEKGRKKARSISSIDNQSQRPQRGRPRYHSAPPSTQDNNHWGEKEDTTFTQIDPFSNPEEYEKIVKNHPYSYQGRFNKVS